MKCFDWSSLSRAERTAALARPLKRRDGAVRDVVRRIFEEVEHEGEAAVTRWSKNLDGRAPERLDLTREVVDRARSKLDREDLAAMDIAAENVRRYHEATKPADQTVEPAPGVKLRRVWRPIETCGLYAPGGTAPLFSTLLMLAIPAAVAGVPNRVTVTPPNREGVAPVMIAAAALSGLEAFYLVGGAQAIAALTFGAGLPRADKIFGPGNAYVAEAKRFAADLPNGPAIDLPAGPSELMVIADATADPALVAADLLSQAEHDADAQVVLAAMGEEVLAAVAVELERQTAVLPRGNIAQASLAEGRVFLVRDWREAADAASDYAPEHLSIQVADPEPLVDAISNAGTIFVGRWAAETFGDYVAGPSHVLPTDGAARTFSGVSTAAFMKSFAIQEATQAGARALAPAAARLARLEGLEAHALAADLRAR
ncbi:MAG TPA: histidinol dehydrogenase [Caulobacteraceae bacterium]